MKKMTFVAMIAALLLPLTVTADELPHGILRDRPSGASKLEIPHYDRIDAALLQQGAARVIVRVTSPPELLEGFHNEGSIKEPERVLRQRKAITAKQERLLEKVSSRHAATAKRFGYIPFMALEVDSDEFQALAASPDIDFIQEDSVVYPTLIQSVPLIGAVGGSFGGFTGLGQTVAILDTGVDKGHPFLTGKVVDEACYSTIYSPYAITSLCPNGQATMLGSGAGLNCSGTLPGCYHGTHVSGIAAGVNASFSGVAKDAKIIAIQVFSRSDSASYCGGTAPCIMAFDSDLIDGLGHVYDLRNSYTIAAVNMSLGGGSYSTSCDAVDAAAKAAIDTLRSAGIATVIASGNDSSSTMISFPGCISSAISVGATTKSDLVASYSNSASFLKLLAPGSSIYSSLPGTGYGYLSGTSMATPHVTGAWAVLKSAKPTATVTEVLNSLTATGVSITDSRNGLVKPRIKLNAAVTFLVPPPPPTVVSTDPAAGAPAVPVTGKISATFSTAMKADTITTSTFTVTGGVTGTVAYDAVTMTATFTPSAILSTNSNYTATITTGVTDATGTPLAAAVSWSFTTQPPKILTVASVNPGSGVSVAIIPSDLSGNGGGSTLFTRNYMPGTGVTLTAPATAGGNLFSSWTGCDSFSGNLCAVTMTSDRSVTMAYVTPTQVRSNVALQANGGVATASAVYSANYPVSAVNNGDRTGAVWGSGGGWYNGRQNSFPEWVQVTFNGEKTINEVDLFSIQDAWAAPAVPTASMLFTKYGVTAFNVQYSPDGGVTWVTLPNGSIVTNNLVWRTITFPAVTTDRVRVQITATSDGYSRLAEIEAYTSVGTPVNISPTVTLTAPVTGASYTAPSIIPLTATAADSDGTVNKVEFYNGATLLGTALTAPYSYSWSGVAAGSYTLTAMAYDNQGAVTTSVAATVTVAAAAVRTNVALQANGGVATASAVSSANYPASAVNNGDRTGAVWGSGGGWYNGRKSVFPEWIQVTFNGLKTIDEVDLFFIQDAWASPAVPTALMLFTKYGVTAFNVQYSPDGGVTWVTVPSGSIVANNLVWRTITFPAVSTDRVRVQITATSDGYSRLAEIEAYTSPVNIPPTVTLTAPVTGATYTAPATIPLTATAADSDGTVSKVEFYNGATLLGTSLTVPYSYSWSGVAAGSYTLTAMAYDNQGAVSTSVAATVTVAAATVRSNVALQANGGVATASAVSSANYPASAVNNGDRTGAVWGSGGGWYNGRKNIFPEWVQVTFNGQKNINEVDLFSIQDSFATPSIPTLTTAFTKYGLTAFAVQYCQDATALTCTATGAGWVTVPNGSITANNLVWRTITFPAVTTDRIRVQITATPDGYSRLAEIEAYTVR